MVNWNSSVFVRQSSLHIVSTNFLSVSSRVTERVCFALFDLLVLPLVAVSRQVAVPLPPALSGRTLNPGRDVSINPNENSILTP